MSGNANNLRIGDVDVYADAGDGAGERHLGHTKGGVEFQVEREFAELLVDQYGSMPLELVLTGNNLTIKTMLAEPTTKNLGLAIPEGAYAERVSGGSVQDSKLGIGRDAGYYISAKQVLLRLHPRRNAPTSLNEDIYIWRAVSVESVPLNYKIDEQRLLEITFRALVDETQPDGYRLGRVGDNPIS